MVANEEKIYEEDSEEEIVEKDEKIGSKMLTPWSFGGQRIQFISHSSTTEDASKAVSNYQVGFVEEKNLLIEAFWCYDFQVFK